MRCRIMAHCAIATTGLQSVVCLFYRVVNLIGVPGAVCESDGDCDLFGGRNTMG